jgi:hypothetical protein
MFLRSYQDFDKVSRSIQENYPSHALHIPFMADWHKIGEQRQSLMDRDNQRKNAKRIDYNYKVRDEVLLINEGILCKGKAESEYGKEPWTITTIWYKWNYQDLTQNLNGTT